MLLPFEPDKKLTTEVVVAGRVKKKNKPKKVKERQRKRHLRNGTAWKGNRGD